jgi:hypothetical protein
MVLLPCARRIGGLLQSDAASGNGREKNDSGTLSCRLARASRRDPSKVLMPAPPDSRPVQ